ncbi:CcoQ/FixQ family Cbb3-type cytochrome c oxidase assembly chaperone [Croceicoccus marinus]|uniref:Cytochrome C oxidase Cbb3 n=1 Tax=Croceicoccus marinus TaxID=450378 RepID=A0A1Z1F9D8_9SPHN|nr:CcoQ/FixQ family Cbb3-type cytochrome c oxidase assembly chaperone [Croceicoccus marinus]ARU15438.1 cytochrome C oxidase Cbb3 [Croceicoccus marinus]
MSVYETLRHFADSYGLVVMLAIFVTLCAWPFRPGAKQHNRAAANLIFKDENDGE